MLGASIIVVQQYTENNIINPCESTINIKHTLGMYLEISASNFSFLKEMKHYRYTKPLKLAMPSLFFPTANQHPRISELHTNVGLIICLFNFI